MSSETVIETTITYLRTETFPARLPPMPTSPRLALMKVEHIPLHFYRYLYRTIGADWLWTDRDGMSDKALAKSVQREGIELTVLYANGAPAGYYELDFAVPDRTNIVYFGLMPEWTGMKIGPWLLGCAMRDAFAHGVSEVTINTCTLDHPAALPMYQRFGFQPVRRETRQVEVPGHMTVPRHVAAQIVP